MTRFLPALAAAALFALPALAPAPAQAGDTPVWTIDGAHSNVGFKVRHMMVSWVRGEFGKVDGTIHLDPKKPESLKLDITIDAASIDTEHEKRDEHLRSPDFFDVAQFPTLTFKSSAVKASPEGLKVTGDLTIRGVTKSVTLDLEPLVGPITDPWGNVKVGTSASTRIDRKDFGLTWNNTLDGGGLVVGDEVHILLEVELNRVKD